MKDQYEQLYLILDEVLNFITPETDVTWSGYQSVSDLLDELKKCKERLINKDPTVFSLINMMFAPTGALQEISIDNNWGNEFIVLSKMVDMYLGKS